MEDTDFDGFMKTLDGLNDSNNKQIDPSSSFDIDIEIDDLLSSDHPSPKKNNNVVKSKSNQSIKSPSKRISVDDHNGKTGEFATMHNEFMQSLKELNEMKSSNENTAATPKLSEMIQTTSIDSAVIDANVIDKELKQLLSKQTNDESEQDIEVIDDEDKVDQKLFLKILMIYNQLHHR